MRALVELRDPVAVALAAATALAAIWFGHGLTLIVVATAAVLVVRLVAGVALRSAARPAAPPAQQVAFHGENWFTPLTRREADVAVLIRDMTNKEIAERLVLSERTIDNHVANIMNKLDLHHRAQIAAWVAERNTAKPAQPDEAAATPPRNREKRF